MNMPERTKDGPKARKDLEFLNIRKDLQMPGKKSFEETETKMETEDRAKKVNKKEEQYCPPPSCFTLDPKEVDQLFKCLARIKVSSEYCGKISRYLDNKKKGSAG